MVMIFVSTVSASSFQFVAENQRLRCLADSERSGSPKRPRLDDDGANSGCISLTKLFFLAIIDASETESVLQDEVNAEERIIRKNDS